MNMSDMIYYIACGLFSAGVLAGIHLMSKVNKAALGNRISVVCIFLAIMVTLVHQEIFSLWALYVSLAVGSAVGLFLSRKVKMIQMPQMVALLNGTGGLASGIVGALAMLGIGAGTDVFSKLTASIALFIGMMTFTGSLVAAGKLHKILSQKPVIYKGHQLMTMSLLFVAFVVIICFCFPNLPLSALFWAILLAVISGLFGYAFSVRIGGADMPITISLLISLCGVAGGIAGLAILNLLLVAISGIVGASGLLLTQIMCRSMNRSLLDILLGKTTTATPETSDAEPTDVGTTLSVTQLADNQQKETNKEAPTEVIEKAQNIIIVPGYGMAIAQAQHLVKELADLLVQQGKKIKYAVHPVAGRMPGHMNILLCEADVDYEDLYEMDAINSEFENADAVIVVGANDVINPAARDAEGTPIYQMPILDVDKCPNIFIFNYDLKPGYAGVGNPLYTCKHGVYLYLGDASETLKEFIYIIRK